jgi:hypothetical protein
MAENTTIVEELEGLDVDSSYNTGWSEYPLDSVFVRKEERSVNEVIKRIRAKRYQLDPDFQRTFVWQLDKQSKLIESCLMRIPLPVFYVAEAKDGRIVVVDGLQRLTTLQRYMDDAFGLVGLASDKEAAENHPLEGKRFKDLPINLQERIEDTQLIFYILDAKAPERARLDIFDRVNSGVPLSRQQMRNSLYNGRATRWLKKAAEADPFRAATGGSLDPKTMRDREAINRFCAFRLLTYGTYRGGDMDGFLGQTLQRMNAMSEEELTQLRASFEHSMTVNQVLFGHHAFRKSLAESDLSARRSILNISLFDVCSTLLVDFPTTSNVHQQSTVRKAITGLLKDEKFSFAITYSTNSTNQIRTRFEMTAAALDKVFV